MQAAAHREHQAHHPVLHVPSVQTYLQQHHAALASLRAGSMTSPPLNNACGAVASDFATQAVLGPGPSVQLRSLEGGQLLRQWALPDVPSPFCPEHTWGWLTATQLVLPFGGRWFFLRADARRRSERSGLTFLDTETGRTEVWSLPPAATWAGCLFCPSRGLVLVEHYTAKDVANFGQHDFLVFSGRGRLVQHMLQSAMAPIIQYCWAPLGGDVIAFATYRTSMYLWQFGAARPILQLAHPGDGCFSIAWRTPFSGCLMALSEDGTLRLVSVGGPVQTLSHTMKSSNSRLGWGVRLACFEESTSELHIHSLQGTCLTMERAVALRDGCHTESTLQVSSCGELCAGVTALDGAGGWHSRQLFIVQLTTGLLVNLPVQITPDSDVARWHLRWAENSSALLVTQALGGSQLFEIIA